MKKFLLLSALATCCAYAPIASAQTNFANTDVASPRVNYAVSARDANSRRWVKITTQTNANGVITTRTNTAYVELASGLNRFSTQSNAWVDADATIGLVGNSAEAANTAHTVTFAQDAATAGGAVNLTTPDGKKLVSRVYGLAYWDRATGSNVLLGEIQSSQGYLAGANEIVYSNAFSSGSVTADLEYFNRLAGMEQNVVLRTALPAPAVFGLNNATSRLQIWTEFLSAPEPQEVLATNDGVMEDSVLDFGVMRMGQGKAFATPQEHGRVGESHVSKHWLHQDGRTFLIEEVPYPAISNAVQNLPPHASIISPSASGVKNIASVLPLRPMMATTNLAAGPILLAKSMPARAGLVLDYVALSVASISTNYNFQNDTTYYLSQDVYFSKTPTFEPGTVIKFYPGPEVYGSIINEGATPMSIHGSLYRPIVFTSADDNSVGERIPVGTGSPTPEGYHQYLEDDYTCGVTNVTISHARFSWAGSAYEDFTQSTHLFRDCQFLQCGSYDTLWLANGAGPGNDLYLENVLFSGISIGLGPYMPVHAANVTADTITNFCDPYYWSGGGGGFTNSILTACDASILTNFVLDHTLTNASGSSIYQAVGAASYYLVSGSPYTNAGTTNIDPALLADLTNLTTYPPTVVSGFITNDVTYGPTVPRNTGLPDYGYHYDPIDVAVVAEVNGATVTILPGTVLANYGGVGYYGLWLYTNATFDCQGTASSPDYLVCYNTVQEQSANSWPLIPIERSGTYGPFLFMPDEVGNAPATANFRFTYWMVLGNGEQLVADQGDNAETIGLQDCRFYGGSIDDYEPPFNVTNSLFQRVLWYVAQNAGGATETNFFGNNLCVGGEFSLQESAYGPWTLQNNLFDQTSIPYQAQSGDVTGYNAYVTNFGLLTASPNTGDVILTNSPAYQTGTLGVNYYPTNLPLINVGSESAAAAGLYHYTVTTNNIIEGTNTVSIGFHYVATDAYGNPLNTAGGSLPDYLADSNGDGVYDAGDPYNWLVNPFNGLTYSSGLQVFTPLK
jgi:hypothetical protein